MVWIARILMHSISEWWIKKKKKQKNKSSYAAASYVQSSWASPFSYGIKRIRNERRLQRNSKTKEKKNYNVTRTRTRIWNSHMPRFSIWQIVLKDTISLRIN